MKGHAPGLVHALMWRTKTFRLLRALALVYLVVVMLVASFQSSLIYHPFHASEETLIEEARTLRLEPWRDAAGAIIGWRSPIRSGIRAENRLLVFHGNAGYALHRLQYVGGFEQVNGGRTWEVYLFEYPGYGARPGEVGEKPFIEAGMAAVEALLQEDPRPVYLLGESLGSGPACAIASRAPKRISGLFLVTPFAALTDVAAHHYPFLPVRMILRDRWENAVALREYKGPVAVRVAALDEIVTLDQGQKLYEAYAGPKRLWTEAGAQHNAIDFGLSGPWWGESSEFVLGVAREQRGGK
ncbi:MAG: hypothetical protein JWQ44_2238 [Chthoniobacter sp.]|nr:hypothetical protein [Chthoniobacter sp.]